MRTWLLVAAALAGCGQDVDPPWQLDHDRVIAVRSTPPRIQSGETAQIDALLGLVGAPPREVDPAKVEVISPTSLATTISGRQTGWFVVAPPASQLVAVRAELGLAADEPVPLRIRVTFPGSDKVGLKVVWLGEHSDNPVLDPVLVDGVERPANRPITVPKVTDIPLSVPFDDTYVVNWLTSAGNMHDFDLANAYLRVEPEDPQEGTLGVVVRDPLGGVAWRLWPITSE